MFKNTHFQLFLDKKWSQIQYVEAAIEIFLLCGMQIK